MKTVWCVKICAIKKLACVSFHLVYPIFPFLIPYLFYIFAHLKAGIKSDFILKNKNKMTVYTEFDTFYLYNNPR